MDEAARSQLLVMSGPHAEEALDFRRIFDKHMPLAWRALRRLGVREADVADVCQEVFMVIHRRLDDFDRSLSMPSWIYGICVRVASEYRRRAPQRREVGADQLPELTSPPNQEEAAERRQARERLDHVLSQLDDARREVFILYEIEELPMREVAAAVGCPLQTAYSRLHAARVEVERAFSKRSKQRSV
ncbi:MAG TPA: sigma-70 family RNA polymerase sigma factor [Polyangiaceae bacterium]|nr:sigma-70 family RNA polymerase sigma factor [Polyangiaceae bacterium]